MDDWLSNSWQSIVHKVNCCSSPPMVSRFFNMKKASSLPILDLALDLYLERWERQSGCFFSNYSQNEQFHNPYCWILSLTVLKVLFQIKGDKCGQRCLRQENEVQILEETSVMLVSSYHIFQTAMGLFPPWNRSQAVWQPGPPSHVLWQAEPSHVWWQDRKHPLFDSSNAPLGFTTPTEHQLCVELFTYSLVIWLHYSMDDWKELMKWCIRIVKGFTVVALWGSLDAR